MPQKRQGRPVGNAQAEIARAFDNPSALAINKARLEHLDSLGLDLEGKTVLEVGAGVGHLTGFWEERGCEVVSTEGRNVLAKEHRRRYPHRDVRVMDLDRLTSYKAFQPFDIVFCYGTLYHVGRPQLVLANLARLCKELFLLETRVSPIDNNNVNPVRETDGVNQSLHGMGCRPAKDWLMAELGKHFPYIYAPVSQPDFPDFVAKWPTVRRKTRAVFVASRQELDLPMLTTELPMRQEKLQI